MTRCPCRRACLLAMPQEPDWCVTHNSFYPWSLGPLNEQATPLDSPCEMGRLMDDTEDEKAALEREISELNDRLRDAEREARSLLATVRR